MRQQSIVDVIVHLLEAAASMQAFDPHDSQEQQMVMWHQLEEAGFSREVVANAYDWLRELIEQQCWYVATEATEVNQGFKASKTLRIFDQEEQMRLSLPVRNFILSLEYAGVLDTKMREIVISQLLQLNQCSIGLMEAKWVVFLVLGSKFQRKIEELRGFLLVTMPQESSFQDEQ